MNTWERHGSGHRPDAPRNDLWQLRLSNPDPPHGSENPKNHPSSKVSGREPQGDVAHGSRSFSSQHGNYALESTSRSGEAVTVSRPQSQKTCANTNSTRTSDQTTRREISTNQGVHADKSQRSSRPDSLVGDLHGRYLFARTRSSPELTDTYGEVSSQGRHIRAPESGKGQTSSSRMDASRRKNLESDNLANHGIRSSTDDPSSVRHPMSHQSVDVVSDSNSASNSYHDDLGLGGMGEEFASVLGAQGMHQEEQDLVNMMASSTGLGFNGQVHGPLNVASSHIPFQIPPSVLASMEYAQRNLGAMVPTNIPLMEGPWGTNMHFPQGLVSPSLAHYFPGIKYTSNPEDSIEPGNENFGSMGMNIGDVDHDFWHEQEQGSTGGFDFDNGSFEMHQLDDKQPTSSSCNFVSSTGIGCSGNSSRVQQKFNKETRASTREDHVDTFTYPENRGTEEYFDDRTVSSRSFPTVDASSLRSKTSSESSWEGSSAKVSKSMREKRGRKMASSAVSSPVYGKGKSASEHSSSQADDDNKEWNTASTVGPEMAEISIEPQAAASLHGLRHQMPGFEPAQTSGSESLLPMAPVILGPGSRQRTTDNSGVIAFYPTGPPVPFLYYNFPTVTGTSDASTSQFSAEESLDNSGSGQNFDSSEGLDQSEMLSTSNSMRMASSIETLEHKSDILNSDFASHWQNLQYGRSCQNSRYPASFIYPSPVMVPPVYLQGRFPWDGPGRPLSSNMNLFTQLMSYGPHLVPVTPLQSMNNRPAGVYQHYVDEMPRYRSGTGTYLPNPVRQISQPSLSFCGFVAFNFCIRIY